MKICMEEHGGWGALLKRPPKLVDTDQLPVAAATEGVRLAAAALAAHAGAHVDVSRAPEGMTYTVTLEGGGLSGTFKLADAALGPEGAALLDWFQRHVS
jgi:Emfourin